MRILYGEWGSVCDPDMKAAFTGLGHEVVSFPVYCKDYNHEEKFEQEAAGLFLHGEMVFTFNYFPVISKVCERGNIPYVCWVYDSPHLTLYSKTVRNSCNHIFLFDHGLYDARKREVPEAAWYYLPLSPHVEIPGKDGVPETPETREGDVGKMQHEVSFVGSLYTENNFYDQIGYLPEYVEGYFKGVMEAQLRIYGLYFMRQSLTGEVCRKFQECAKFDLGKEYEAGADRIVADVFLSRKLASTERQRLLLAAAKAADVSLFTGSPAESLVNEFEKDRRGNKALAAQSNPGNLRVFPKVDYQREMPLIFRTSRINLNLSLRTIETGIPLRVLDILGAGGFLLSNYQAELSEYFKEGEEFACFADEKELQEKISYYLSHEEERRRIAENGQRKVLALFSYKRQVERLMDCVTADLSEATL